MKKLKEWVWDFVKEEDAVGVVEIILILVVLIGLVIIFKGADHKFGKQSSFQDSETK